jgi:hypothetical protein
MTTSRPDDYRKCPSMKERSSRDNVYSYIFQLQTEALRALPESGKPRPGDKFPLRGKRTPGDERKLRLVVNSIFDSLRDLEKLLPQKTIVCDTRSLIPHFIFCWRRQALSARAPECP